jgi:hypothetical protein
MLVLGSDPLSARIPSPDRLGALLTGLDDGTLLISVGTVTVTGPRTVRVTVTVPGEYQILGVIGAGGYQVDGTAEATLTVGVDTGTAR